MLSVIFLLVPRCVNSLTHQQYMLTKSKIWNFKEHKYEFFHTENAVKLLMFFNNMGSSKRKWRTSVDLKSPELKNTATYIQLKRRREQKTLHLIIATSIITVWRKEEA
jgi:hypothetical protein